MFDFAKKKIMQKQKKYVVYSSYYSKSKYNL